MIGSVVAGLTQLFIANEPFTHDDKGWPSPLSASFTVEISGHQVAARSPFVFPSRTTGNPM
jgi:hypothetical protein